jgi:acyl carrier protein
MDAIEQSIRRLFRELYGDKPLDHSTRLVNDLGLDSLDLAEVLVSVEKEFDIEITEQDWERLCTFGDVIACVNKIIAINHSTHHS